MECFEYFVQCFGFHCSGVVTELSGRSADVCCAFGLDVQFLGDPKHPAKQSSLIMLP
jgi:hypothetical protein